MEGYNHRWIDIYENENKRSGAYSWGAYGTHPYVLLNYNDTLDNVYTLAHEMGHAIHSYHSDREQPYIYAGYRIFVAEVASTCNEALLIDYMLKNTEDKKEKAYLINHFLEKFKGTLYRQTMFAEFEMITHSMVEKGESLTAEALCRIYHDLNVAYFGDDIVIDPAIDMEWSRIPHFYNAFYVYQYATGYSAAIALSRRILKEGPEAVTDYIRFLSSGSSNSRFVRQ
jgi:oligoendopeptidase F